MNIIWCGNINRAWTVMTEIQTWTKPTKSIQFTFYTTQRTAVAATAVVVRTFIRSFHFISLFVSFVVAAAFAFAHNIKIFTCKWTVGAWRNTHTRLSALRTSERTNQRTNIFNNNSNSSNSNSSLSYVSVCAVCCMYSVHSLTVSPIVAACMCVCCEFNSICTMNIILWTLMCVDMLFCKRMWYLIYAYIHLFTFFRTYSA